MIKIIYSGICVCGHKWDEHHLGMVVNAEAFQQCVDMNHPPYIPQECEFFGCNEDGGLDQNGKPHCFGYLDKDDPLIPGSSEYKKLS